MKYTWIETTIGNGSITGFNRNARESEKEGECNWQEDGIWGLDINLYKVVDDEFTSFTQEEKDIVDEERQVYKEKKNALNYIEAEFVAALNIPIEVILQEVSYYFTAGYESSQRIDSARILADNLNENNVELWDFFDEPQMFSKSEANEIAIAVGLSFRENYSAMKHAKRIVINEL